MINEERLRKFAELVGRLNYKPISFTNPELFPEKDEFIYPNYVFFMVAIDHRTGFDVKFKYRGSDLLFYLARRKQKEDREFFTAKRLVAVSDDEIRKIFTYMGKTVSLPEERAMLLRDCAEKLLRHYKGDVMVLLSESEYKVDRILENLKIFKAYEDPLMKKSYLLLKILKREGYGIRGKLKFPVDSVLVKVSISSGILNPPAEVMEKINSGTTLSYEETKLLREKTQEALMLVSELAEIEPDVLDDVLWAVGREIDNEILLQVDKEALAELVNFLKFRDLRVAFPQSWYF